MNENYNIKGLAHICVYSRDIKKSIDFYTTILDFTKVYNTTLIKDDGSGLQCALLKFGTCLIELLAPDDHSSIPDGHSVVEHFALEVQGLEALYATLKVKEIRFKTEIFQLPKLFKGGCKGFFIYGPEQELIELFEYISETPFYDAP